jgi:hypothetical protein
MRRGPVSFEAAVRAFRDATAVGAEGAATRARVLARASGSAERRTALRRLGPLLAAALVVLSSAAAVTAAVRSSHWRRGHAAEVLVVEEAALPPRPTFGGPLRVIPFATADSEPAAFARAPAGAEDRAYGRAHRAHFVDDAPARALAAWDAYLRAYPAGVFAPEARYNRAVCLVRLGRFAEAETALRPFARGGPGGYRREEALVLLEWLSDQRHAR